jgi:ATP-dependent DNA helicase HFM1/MER3
MAKHRGQYTTEMTIIFKNINNLIRCIIDCQVYLGDSVSIHSALMLERSLGSRIWDDSPLQMKQIESIGVVGVRKFVNAGIRTMEDLEACEPSRIEALIGRNPPYGMKVLETVKTFPKLRISLHVQPASIVKCAEGVKIQVKSDIGFLNEKPPQRFASKLVYVCLLAETSDGRKIHFARISGQKLGYGQMLVFPAVLTSPDQSINCYVMCDSIAGSLRGATVKPKIAPSMFPAPKLAEPNGTPRRSNTSKRRIEPITPVRKRSSTSDDFGDDGIDDEELVKATCGDVEFEHIDNFANPTDSITWKNTAKNKAVTNAKTRAKTNNVSAEDEGPEPVQLSNGKWACKHPCKDKNACKHLCCKEGMDRPPKKPTVAKHATLDEAESVAESVAPSQRPKSTQSKLQLSASKRKVSSSIDELDLTQEVKRKKSDYAKNGARDFRDLHQLHKTVQKKDPLSTLHSVMHTKPAYCYSQGGEHNLSFLQSSGLDYADHADHASDYGDAQLEDLSPYFDEPQAMPGRSDFDEQRTALEPAEQAVYSFTRPMDSRGSDTFDDDDSLLGDAMVGLADSHNLQGLNDGITNTTMHFGDLLEMELDPAVRNDEVPMHLRGAAVVDNGWFVSDEVNTADAVPVHDAPVHKPRAPFYNSSSSPQKRAINFKPAISLLQDPEVEDFEHMQVVRHTPHIVGTDKDIATGVEVLDLLDMFDDGRVKEGMPVPEAFQGLEPWLYEEFGDIVELVDEVLPA